MPEFDITMLGPARAGKTSLLASVYHQFIHIRDEGLEIRPVGEAGALLSNYIDYLKETFDTPTKMPKNNGDLVPPTNVVGAGGSSDLQYRFNLGRRNRNPAVQLVFRDYPGGQIFDKREEVIKRIRDCAVTMITIDTPALMVEKSKANSFSFHQHRNLPVGMYEVFQEAYSELKSNKLVLLVPVKCERWMENENSTSQLLERLREGYELLLNFLASSDLRHKVAVAVTPVQTLGNMIYAYMDDPQNYSARYMKKSILSKYEPKDCEQPLRYMLRFVLNRFLENPGILNSISFFFSNGDLVFKDAVSSFAKGCKPYSGQEAGGFTILQGKHLLR